MTAPVCRPFAILKRGLVRAAAVLLALAWYGLARGECPPGTVKVDERRTETADAIVVQDVCAPFSGKRVYRLTAKSWIDPSVLDEFTFVKWKIRLSANEEPVAPQASARFDYKLFQTFTAEVVFEGGKVKAAQFVPNSEDQRANTTLRLPGAVKTTQRQVVIAADGFSADFTRTIEGRPNLVILIPDISLLGSLKPIENTLKLHVTAAGAIPTGEGTAFPSHKFWIHERSQDRMFDSRRQVQPSEYFNYP